MGFFKKLVRPLTAVATGGLSEFTKSNPFGVPGAGQYMPIVGGTALGALMGNPMMGAQIGAGLFSAQQSARAQQDANMMNLGIAREQMAFSASQADKQMAFQERMSGTSFQRNVEDLRKAGLNPLLALPGGASTPGGAAGSSASATMDVGPPVAERFMSSAYESMRLNADLKSAKALAKKADSEGDLAQLERDYARKNPDVYFSSKFGSADTLSARVLDKTSHAWRSAEKESGLRLIPYGSTGMNRLFEAMMKWQFNRRKK